MTRWRVIDGDCRDVLRSLDAESIQTCVTSPPYFGLRDYGHGGQIGLEPTPGEFVAALVGVFREVRRVLRDDGTVWLNLGDSYYSPTATQGRNEHKSMGAISPGGIGQRLLSGSTTYRRSAEGVKPKDLLGIPWMVAFALRADGWYLRSEVIWHKPNPMPESVTDRPTKAHEQVFLLSKSSRYFYDADAIREPSDHPHLAGKPQRVNYADGSKLGRSEVDPHVVERTADRNRRSVWTVPSAPFAGAHFATFPPKLIEPCILAGSREGDTVLDPFNGAGTTGMVALRHGRSYVGIELNPAYAELARRRIVDDAPLLNAHSQLDEAA